MLSFRNFYSNKFSALKKEMSSAELLVLFPAWVSHLRDNIIRLQIMKIIPLKTAKDIDQALRGWQENPAKNMDESLSLNYLDRLYEKFINHLTSQIISNPTKLEIPFGYPFEKHISGVKIEARIILSDKELALQSNGESIIGSKNSKKDTGIKAKLYNIPWLSKIIPSLDQKPQLPDPAHAETNWFLNHSQALIDSLEKDQRFLKLPALNDELPVIQLTQRPRLEIITSTACCREYCQPLFSALRKYLNSVGINLPIVLYAGSSYNSPDELKGSINVIKSTGEFYDTKRQCNLEREQLTLPGDFIIEPSTKQQKDYAYLARIGGIAIVQLMKLPVSEAIMSQINPITYLAPDALIIYAAELTTAPADIKKLVPSLIERLDNMDRRVLIAWRMAFIDQLHWLLISSLDARYKEAALSNIDGTNCAIPTTREDLSQDKFFSSFSTLIERFKLDRVYPKMLTYFTERGHERMPLGCMVGPLSAGMRHSLWNTNKPAEVPESTNESAHQLSKTSAP